MKSPDEIKKGLECCGTGKYGNHKDCPYDIAEPQCMQRLLADALALIQQLEEQCKHMNDLRDAAAERALKMEERVHQLEAERDSAVKDMSNCVVVCNVCKHKKACMDVLPCNACSVLRNSKESRFEWRGVQKEDGNA